MMLEKIGACDVLRPFVEIIAEMVKLYQNVVYQLKSQTARMDGFKRQNQALLIYLIGVFF
jgi:hypothetical protein